MRNLLAIALLGTAITPLQAQAVLCKYIDEAGNITYSDSEVKGAKKGRCFEAPPVPQPPPQRPAAVTPNPPDAARKPPFANDTQPRSREEARRRILEQELAQEEKALEDARKALAAAEDVRLGSEKNYQRYLDRVQPLRDEVANHERNVQQLRQELAKLR